MDKRMGDKILKSYTRSVLLCAIYIAVIVFTVEFGFSVEPDSDATCGISVTVSPMMEWAGNFPNITLAAINSYADAPEDNKTQTLYTNCDLTIGADNTLSGPAELSSTTDTLVTKYKLAEDGDGTSTTGASVVDEGTSGISTWTVYSNFLSIVLPITHVNTDGAVDITLYVQATNPAGEVADQGSYSATQTLTAAWTSD